MSLIDEENSNDDTLADTFGGRIIRARETAKLSTAQLARRIGVLTETMQAWESDRLMPRTNQIMRLSGLLNVSPTWLLMERGESPSDEIDESEIESLQRTLGQLRGNLLTVIGGLELVEKRLEQYESYR
ncbi:MAG: helix-turn-helix domain-containing protein [Gammaproteobacteria bacterium]|jgi:transcriptional regulator with XRE-family HTH domain|nr:helix-turn-helix domain-containing protein [Gammaproteobacteria bacterium]